MDGIAYTWDDNGNLLSDGARSYSYDHANRLVGVSGVGQNVSYAYNGLGDRLSETVNSETTYYTLDLNAGLTQVLADGTNTYLYGVSRIAQYDASSPQYFLGDSLVSVRQLVDASGNVTLARSYQPYGEVLAAAGEGATNYGFTNEWTDTTGLVNLRSRYYSSAQGRFITSDMWEGDYTRPLSMNEWIYVEANPVNYKDPAGKYKSPYSKAGIPCPIQEAAGWIQIDKGVWIYQPGNPVSCGSPSGFSPNGQGDNQVTTNYRDLTDWLYRELVTNANGPEVHRWRMWNRIALALSITGAVTCDTGVELERDSIIYVGGVIIAGGLVFHAASLYQYGMAVKDGAKWDVKDEIGLKLGPGITLCTSPSQCHNNIEFSVPGNIHFAYIGAASEILGLEINAGAAYAEINDPAHDPNTIQYTSPYVGPESLQQVFGSTWWNTNTWNFGDEPIDHEAVNFGISLWKKYKSGLTMG